MPTHTVYLSLALVASLLTACQSYDFTINDNLVYTPKQLFNDFNAPDPALDQCLRQAVIDNKIVNPAELTALNCSHAGIENLEGLATFTNLEQLKLSSNKIRNLSAITRLSHLQELYLDDNVVVDPVPLYPLSTLRLVDLRNNPPLQCPSASAFAALESVRLPSHCS